jgi:poly(A) polymerase
VETDGRHATVAFTDDWQADASRRDFTMNALYCDADGTIFDPLGAYPDLAARRVRFIGDPIARIREDYLRVLRFFRFNAAYGAGPFDQAGLVACARERAGLARLSAERIRSELVRLLVAPRAAAALQVMLEWDLLLPVIGRVPYLAAFRRVTAIEEELDSTPDAMLRLAALAVRIPEDVDYLADRLRLSNVEHAALLDHVHAASKAVPKLACDMTELAAKAVLYRLGPDGFRRRVLFAWLLSRAPVNDQEWQQLLTLPDRWEAPKLPVSGRHLAAAGVAPGPGMGELLRALEQDWIDGGFVATREQLLAAAKRLSAAPRP